MSELKPRRGALAYCRHGRLGLILHDRTFPRRRGGERVEVWVGIHLTDRVGSGALNRPGAHIAGPWESSSPRVVGYTDDLAALLEKVTLPELAETVDGLELLGGIIQGMTETLLGGTQSEPNPYVESDRRPA